ncbi:MAG: DUF459 domain-containing protein [Hyphomicrobiales bacterium]|nr:DUF459 domain-containing protein [Hyphomicrobiales bacterium]
MRHFPIRAHALDACRVMAALVFALSLFAFASQAKAEPPLTLDQPPPYERDWQAQQEKLQARAPRAVKRSRRSEAPADAGGAEEEPVAKLDDARIVLVVGDFMAAGLADALAGDYAQSAGVKIVDRTSGSSGLVRTDYYDWPSEIGPIMDEARPSIVVVMIGANDRQVMTIGTAKEPPRSDAWTTEYVKRVAALTKAVRDRRIPLVWVGQPAFKYASMSSDMLAFDDIYQRVVEAAGGEYVDIWDGFVDENGAFRFTGPDVSGQPVRLRSDDGITLSNAGKRKVAFYAEKPLNKLLGNAAAPGGEPLPSTLPGNGPADMSTPSLDRTPPISLSGRPVDGNTDLLGSKIGARPKIARTATERLTTEGLAPAPPPGRADHFGGADGAAPAMAPGSDILVPAARNMPPIGNMPLVGRRPGVKGAVKP